VRRGKHQYTSPPHQDRPNNYKTADLSTHQSLVHLVHRFRSTFEQLKTSAELKPCQLDGPTHWLRALGTPGQHPHHPPPLPSLRLPWPWHRHRRRAAPSPAEPPGSWVRDWLGPHMIRNHPKPMNCSVHVSFLGKHPWSSMVYNRWSVKLTVLEFRKLVIIYTISLHRIFPTTCVSQFQPEIHPQRPFY
jgi:hypothetical protein